MVGRWKFDDGTGTTALDSSGNDNHASVRNGASFTAGRSGTASTTTGTAAQHLRVARSASLDSISTELTIATWVRPQSPVPGGFQTIATRQLGTSFLDQFFLGLHGTRPLAALTTSAGTSIVRATNAVPTGSWSHVALTYDGATIRLFVNGTEVATTPHTGSLGATVAPLLLAGAENGPTSGNVDDLLNGSLDDLLITRNALTAAAIEALAGRTAPPPSTTTTTTAPTTTAPTTTAPTTTAPTTTAPTTTAPTTTAPTTTTPTQPVQGSLPNVVGRWKMDDGSGTVALDSSGNGNHAFLRNGVTFTTGRNGTGATNHTLVAGQHLRVTRSASLDTPTNKLSITAWVDPGTTPMSGWQTIAGRQLGTASNDQWILTLNSGRPVFLISTVAGVSLIAAPDAIVAGAWTHLAGTYDGRTMRLYVNGTEVVAGPSSGNLSVSTRDLLIGAGANDDVAGSAEEQFTGRLDDVVLAAAAFSAAQVKSLATDAPLPVESDPPTSEPGGRTPVLYLTFDDGPEPPYTRQLLELFERHDVDATFFVLGAAVNARPEMLNEIVDAGHAIGNHTWDHPALPELSRFAITSQLTRSNDIIVATTGRRPTCMRPPFGSMNATAREVSAELGLDVVIWDLAVYDGGTGRPAEQIIEVLDTATDGMVINLHDGGGDRSETVRALDTWLTANAGRYDFRSLPNCRLVEPGIATPRTP